MPPYRTWMLFLALWEKTGDNVDVPTRSNQIRRKSMQGTLLLALGILAVIAFAVTGSIWAAVAAAVLLVTAVLLLYQVGKSLP